MKASVAIVAARLAALPFACLACSSGAPGVPSLTVPAAPKEPPSAPSVEPPSDLPAYAPTPGLAPMPPPTRTDPESGHACTEVVGFDNAVLTFDWGKTLVQSKTPRRERFYVKGGLVSMGAPYTLGALAENHIYLSTDGGCHWSDRGTTRAHAMGEGRGGVAYAWSRYGDVLAISAAGVTTLRAPCDDVRHVGGDPHEARHLKLIGRCGVFDSNDAGGSWRRTGEPPLGLREGDARAVATYAPSDMNRAIFLGRIWTPMEVTSDGAHTWSQVMTETRAHDVLFGRDDLTFLVLGAGPIVQSNDGGRTFITLFNPELRQTPGCLVTGRPLSSPLAFVMEGQEDRTSRQNRLAPVFRRDYLARLDLDARALTSVPLPLDARDCNRERTGCSSGDAVDFAAYVEGEHSAVVLAVGRRGPTEFGDW